MGGISMISSNFFDDYQKKNIMIHLKNTIEKTINNWLKDDNIKLDNLRKLSEVDIDSDTLPANLSLPDFIRRLWSDPHQTFNTLSPSISKGDVRNLTKETAENIVIKPGIKMGGSNS